VKIAICVSGQLRTWKKCYKSWMGLFDSEQLKQSKLNQFKEIGLQASIALKSTKSKALLDIPITPISKDSSREKWSAKPVVDTPSPMVWELNLNDSVATYNELVSNPKIEIDYFVHTWNYNSISAGHASNAQKKTQKLLTKSELDEFKNIVKPKKILIEDKETSYSKIRWSQDDMPLLGYARSMLYAMFKVAELKKQYEKENNFEYDVCVRIRPDLFFDELGKNAALWSFNIPRDNFIHTVHCGHDGEFPYFYAGDIFSYASSKTFDIINDFYNCIDDIDVKLFEKEVVDENGNVYKNHGHTRLENLFVHYFMQNNIKIRALPHGPYVTGSSIFLDDPEARKRLKKYGF
jgi:hypothetical protein